MTVHNNNIIVVLGYMTPLNMLNLSFKIFARLATETSLAVLSTLLLDWLEHLKTPLIDKVV